MAWSARRLGLLTAAQRMQPFADAGSVGAALVAPQSIKTSIAEMAARRKAALFPDEGGPAILEVSVPAWILDSLYADPIANGLARSGEIRFEAGSGLEQLRSEWHNLPKRVIPL